MDPSKFYLGRTNEYTKTKNLVPLISGLVENSTTGFQTHVTAGFGDNGFEGTWTLEITCLEPLRVYPNQKIGYILYQPLKGNTDIVYNGKYQHQVEATESRFFKEYKVNEEVEEEKTSYSLENESCSAGSSNDLAGGMLSSIEIKKQIEEGNISIDKVDLNSSLHKPNSCDLRLANVVYAFDDFNKEIDMYKSSQYFGEVMSDQTKYLRRIEIGQDGILLKPGVTYLSRTSESISTNGFVPVLYGKTSNSLIGLSIELNSGYYQSDYKGPLFLSIRCTKPTIIYPNIKIGQLTFFRNVNEHLNNSGMLTGTEILSQMDLGNIIISPQDNIVINPNSVNLTLNKEIRYITDTIIDMAKDSNMDVIDIGKSGGLLLKPSEIYIARTNEWTETYGFVPCIDGRSSVGRKGINVHCSGGLGSIGYKGYWNLGIKPVEPIVVEEFMKICQIYYYTVDGQILKDYSGPFQDKSEKDIVDVYTRKRVDRHDL